MRPAGADTGVTSHFGSTGRRAGWDPDQVMGIGPVRTPRPRAVLDRIAPCPRPPRRPTRAGMATPLIPHLTHHPALVRRRHGHAGTRRRFSFRGRRP